MTTIEKLTEYQTFPTKEVWDRKWVSVSAKKLKLLSLSDWTQLADCTLPQNIKNVWKQWRQRVRAIKRSAIDDPDKAMELLKGYERSCPSELSVSDDIAHISEAPAVNEELEAVRASMQEDVKKYFAENVSAKMISIEDVTALVNAKLEQQAAQFQTLIQSLRPTTVPAPAPELPELKAELLHLNDKINAMDFSAVSSELYAESVDFLVMGESDHNWPLLQVSATHHNMTLHDMAEQVVQQKKTWLREACKKEELRLNYAARINALESIEDALKIQQELNGH